MDGVNAKLQSQPVLGYISASMAYNSPRHRWRYHASKCITCILTPRHGPKLPTPAVPLTINLAPLDGLPAPRLASSLLNIALYHPSSKNDIFSSLPIIPPLRLFDLPRLRINYKQRGARHGSLGHWGCLMGRKQMNCPQILQCRQAMMVVESNNPKDASSTPMSFAFPVVRPTSR